jgi:hypothetical protein
MPQDEKTIRVKRLRIVADELVVEPARIIISRRNKKDDDEYILRLEK